MLHAIAHPLLPHLRLLRHPPALDVHHVVGAEVLQVQALPVGQLVQDNVVNLVAILRAKISELKKRGIS